MKPKTPKTYHHGDLKNAASAMAESLLAETGIEALTLREVARRVGVSHAALYRHYPDRGALLADVACSGFERLQVALARAEKSAPAGDAVAALRALLDAYIGFAKRNTPLFRLMFGAEVAARERYPELAKATDGSFARMAAVIERAREGGSLRAGIETRAVAAGAFAMAHGLAVLIMNGLLRAGGMKETAREVLVEQAFQCLWLGVGARPGGSAVGV